MEPDQLAQLNELLRMLNNPGDVTSYELVEENRIDFPGGFLRTMAQNRAFFPFVQNDELNNKLASHMMHRDMLHWLWLKTKIWGYARHMVVKFQLINLGSILEAVVKHLTDGVVRTNAPTYDHIDYLQGEGRITNGADLKRLWADRKSIHVHLTGDVDEVEFSDGNYQLWHSAMGKMIEDLNIQRP